MKQSTRLTCRRKRSGRRLKAAVTSRTLPTVTKATGAFQFLENHPHSGLAIRRLPDPGVPRRLQRSRQPDCRGNPPTGQRVQLGDRQRSRTLFLGSPLIQHDALQVDARQGVHHRQIEMVVGVFVGVKQIGAVNDRFARQCRHHLGQQEDPGHHEPKPRLRLKRATSGARDPHGGPSPAVSGWG